MTRIPETVACLQQTRSGAQLNGTDPSGQLRRSYSPMHGPFRVAQYPGHPTALPTGIDGTST